MELGTGINAHPEFGARFARKLADRTGCAFEPNGSYFESLSSQDAAVELSGQLKTVAVSIMKMANDLRWMNSGPLAGLGEIALPALQPGSSIMPGKINPVIPEAVAMVAAQVIGNDAAIAIADECSKVNAVTSDTTTPAAWSAPSGPNTSTADTVLLPLCATTRPNSGPVMFTRREVSRTQSASYPA